MKKNLSRIHKKGWKRRGSDHATVQGGSSLVCRFFGVFMSNWVVFGFICNFENAFWDYIQFFFSLFVQKKNVSCLPQTGDFRIYLFWGDYPKTPLVNSKMPSEETRLPVASEEKRGSLVLEKIPRVWVDLISFCKTKKPAKTLMCEFMNGTCITVPSYAILNILCRFGKLQKSWPFLKFLTISEREDGILFQLQSPWRILLSSLKTSLLYQKQQKNIKKNIKNSKNKSIAVLLIHTQTKKNMSFHPFTLILTLQPPSTPHQLNPFSTSLLVLRGLFRWRIAGITGVAGSLVGSWVRPVACGRNVGSPLMILFMEDNGYINPYYWVDDHPYCWWPSWPSLFVIWHPTKVVDSWWYHTVDRNPAFTSWVWSFILLFIWFYTPSQVCFRRISEPSTVVGHF